MVELLTPCSVPRGGVLKKNNVHNDCPGRRVFAPSSRVPGGKVLDEIDSCIIKPLKI